MPETYQDVINLSYNSPEVLKAQQQLDESLKALDELIKQQPGFSQREYSKLATADPAMQSLVKQRPGMVSKLYSQPFAARNQYKDIFDPNVRDQLVSQSVGNVLGQLSGVDTLMEQRKATINDRVQLAVEQFNAQLTAAQQKAQDAQGGIESIRKYLLDIGNAAMKDQQQQFENQIALQKLAISRAGSGDGDVSLPTANQKTWNILNTYGITRKPSTDANGKSTGGWEFFKDGTPVSFEEVINLVPEIGLSPKDVLYGSANPQDEKYLSTTNIFE